MVNAAETTSPGQDLARFSPNYLPMKYRTFDDYLGRRWEVWQTDPSLANRREIERRVIPDRRAGRRADSSERRTTSERRNASLPSFPALPQLQSGWLCFEREGPEKERKRLAPVPSDWETADDMTLAALCNFASEKITHW
jgi:hypothetical protein